MKENVVLVYTGSDINMMIAEGGSGYWILGDSRRKEIEYLMAFKNDTQDWSILEKNVPKGTAFFIAKISGYTKMLSGEFKGKYLIKFSEYAEIVIPNAWEKARKDPRSSAARQYRSMEYIREVLQFEPSTLIWKPFIAAENANPQR